MDASGLVTLYVAPGGIIIDPAQVLPPPELVLTAKVNAVPPLIEIFKVADDAAALVPAIDNSIGLPVLFVYVVDNARLAVIFCQVCPTPIVLAVKSPHISHIAPNSLMNIVNRVAVPTAVVPTPLVVIISSEEHAKVPLFGAYLKTPMTDPGGALAGKVNVPLPSHINHVPTSANVQEYDPFLPTDV